MMSIFNTCGNPYVLLFCCREAKFTIVQYHSFFIINTIIIYTFTIKYFMLVAVVQVSDL